MACGDFKHPLHRDGAAQTQRLAPALQPGYVRVDEKDEADWVVYAEALSEHIHYYDLNNAKAGSWKPYFSADIAAVLAFVSVQDAEAFKGIAACLTTLRTDANQANLPLLQKTLGELFGVALTFPQALDKIEARLTQDASLQLPLGTVIRNLIRSKLAPALNRLLAYYQAAGGLLVEVDDPAWVILGLPVGKPSTVISGGLSSDWITDGSVNWTAYMGATPPDASIFGDPAGAPAQKIRHAANHNLFTAQFDQYLMAYARILQEANANLQRVLGDWRRHPPHYALFLSFLKLLKSAQSDLNQLTSRHLEFYYSDVLRLTPRKPDPDSAYLTVELAKAVPQYLLPSGTLFRAGKDSGGQEVYYGLTKDVVVNKASVGKLMAVYQGGEWEKDKLADCVGRLYAAPVINSADGLGAKLVSPRGEWHPFVNRTYADGQVRAIAEPLAQIGFALASHYLALAEGRREVTIGLEIGPHPLPKGVHFDVFLTTAKGWYQVPADQINIGSIHPKGGARRAEIRFTLDPLAPAVTDYDPVLHGGTLGAKTPALKCILQNIPGRAYKYDSVRDITLHKVELSVDVGGAVSGGFSNEAAKQLLLAGGTGPLDPSKPFLPFGTQPVADDTFIVGSKEIFCKKGAQVRFNLEWIKLPPTEDEITVGVAPGQADYLEGVKEHESQTFSQTVDLAYGANGHFNFKYGVTGTIKFDNATFGDPLVGTEKKGYYRVVRAGGPGVAVEYLRGGVWAPLGGGVDIFNGTTSHVSFPPSLLSVPDDGIVSYRDPLLPYSNQSSGGFFRIKLNGSFGHKEYQAAKTNYLISQAKSGPGGPPPPEPYTPTLQSLLVSYTATAGLDVTTLNRPSFNDRDIQFFHLYPFGDAEQHVQLNGGGVIYLLPQFRYIETPSDPGAGSGGASMAVRNQGEFYLGLQDVTPGQSVSILFQVLEGSTDPLIIKPTTPESQLHFSYLSNNLWKAIRSNLVGDGTRQLIQSGLIELAIPPDATAGNTLLPSGYVWLRLSIQDTPDAVCKLVAVLPQAVLVKYQAGPKNAPDFPAGPLPAGTIAKLKEPDSAIKKIQQPYASFRLGGGAENEAWFHARVSERLRHKDRGITIWDYERLVLQKFPQIHKVKCLSHTKLAADPKHPGKNVYSELAPGFVLVVTVPDLTLLNEPNPLRPYTNADLLAQIKEYLQTRATCHAQVLTANPLFEELRMEFTVTLMKGFNDTSYYRQQLQNDLTQYLTPWAFGGGQEIQFGGKVYKSGLIDFIENRPYVDYLTEVKLYHKPDDSSGQAVQESEDLEEVTASTARSILVSAPANRHQITVLLHEDTTGITEICSPNE